MFILPGQNPVVVFVSCLAMAISDELVSYFRVWTTTSTMQIYGFVQTIRTSNSCGLSLDFAMQFATIGGKFSTFLKKNTTSYSGWCIFQSHVLRIVHIYIYIH